MGAMGDKEENSSSTRKIKKKDDDNNKTFKGKGREGGKPISGASGEELEG